MTQYRSYVIMLSSDDKEAMAALATYHQRRTETLREARRITEAIAVLFPQVRARIASLGVAVKPEPKMLDG